MYALFIDYYMYSAQWGKARIVHFKTPKDVGVWARNAGFNGRPMFNVFRSNHSERYIVAFERTMEKCETMLYHLNMLADMGADDHIVFAANSMHFDIRGWNRARWHIPEERVTGNGAQRLTALGANVSEIQPQAPEGAGRYDGIPF